MGLSINQNIAAVNAYHNLSNTQNDLSKSLEKLSSGFRINRAADDAAGLAISEGLRSQIGGLKVAVRNAQDGTSVVQTAEGALNETTSILQRMRDLSVQASNAGGLSSDAKGNIQSEMGQLKSELTRISDTTQFNGTKLLDGSYKGVFQVGANVGETISVGVSQIMSAGGLGVGNVDVTVNASTTGSQATGLTLDMKATTAPTLSLNGKALDLKGWSTGGTVQDAAANKAIFDQAAGAALSGSGFTATSAWDATTNTTLDLTFSSTKTDFANAAAVKTALNASGFTGTEADVANTATISVDGAADAITKIDAAIKTVSTVRADLGAVQNRFDHTVKNLNVAVENLSASESRIRDTDMASEMVSFTRAQILSQAGTSMLAQANQLPQSVLKLLG